MINTGLDINIQVKIFNQDNKKNINYCIIVKTICTLLENFFSSKTENLLIITDLFDEN